VKIYTLKCISGFRDGNVFPRFINPSEIIKDVDERLYHRFTKSDPDGFEVLEIQTIVPPPTKSKPQSKTKTEADVEKNEEDSNGTKG